MPKLVAPTVAVHESFLSALAEFHGEGRNLHLDPATLADHDAFAAYVDYLRQEALSETPRATGLVASTTLWWIDEAAYLGRVAIRHELTTRLRFHGGHIGYEVRPTARGRGHAKQMLAGALPIAHELAIDPALITCEAQNLASRRVIEFNGGRLAEHNDDMLYFWVPTGPEKG